MKTALRYAASAAAAAAVLALAESGVVILFSGAVFATSAGKLRFILYELALFYLCGLLIGLAEFALLEGGARLLGVGSPASGAAGERGRKPSRRIAAVVSLWGLAAAIPIFTLSLYYASLHAIRQFHVQSIMAFFISLMGVLSLGASAIAGALVGRVVKASISGTSIAAESPPKGKLVAAAGLPVVIIGGFLGAVIMAHYRWLQFAADFRAVPYAAAFVVLQTVFWRRGGGRRAPAKRAACVAGAAAVAMAVLLSGWAVTTEVLFIAAKNTVLEKRVLLCLNRFSGPPEAPVGIGIGENELTYRKPRECPVDRAKLRRMTGDTAGLNVLFITVDALRADRLGCYGHARNTSPRMDALAEEGVLFRNAYIQAGDSPNSLARCFTSRYKVDPFDPKGGIPLAQIMTNNGFKTMAVYDGAIWDRYRKGFLRGFDHYLITDFPYEQVFSKSSGQDLNRLALEGMRRAKGGRFFMWMHYIEAHSPYRPHPETKDFGGGVTDLYDGEIAAADRCFGALLEEMKSLDLYDDTIIVLSADHGEEFQEHGDSHHGRQLYNESIRVPLIMKLPGVRGKKIPDPVKVIDFVPTIVQLLDLKTGASFDGRSLIPLIYFDDRNCVSPVYAYITRERLDAKMIIDGDWKLIYTARNNTYELYNLRDDPGEKNNLFGRRGDVAARLAAELFGWVKIELGQEPPGKAGAVAQGAGTVKTTSAAQGPKQAALPALPGAAAPDAAKAELREPRGIVRGRDGMLYVSDFGNNCIRKLSPEGKILATWGKGGSGPEEFNNPKGIAADSRGMIYVSDAWNQRIQKLDAAGRFVARYEAALYAPSGVAVDALGNIFVADNGHNCVKKLGPDGKLIATIGRKGGAKGEFILPVGVAVSEGGDLYVADSGNRRIQVFDSAGVFKKAIPVDGWPAGVFNLPYIGLGGSGDIYVTDPLNNRALKLSAKGALVGVLRPGKGDKDLLNTPTGIALDEAHGLVYLVDTWNHCVRRFPLSGFAQAK